MNTKDRQAVEFRIREAHRALVEIKERIDVLVECVARVTNADTVLALPLVRAMQEKKRLEGVLAEAGEELAGMETVQ